jgi:PPM family protein phosphatase
MQKIVCEQKGNAALAWVKGSKHTFYEDRARILSKAVPLVEGLDRGEIFAVFDGIGSAPKGREAAQFMIDQLVRFYREPDNYAASIQGLESLLMAANLEIHGWGYKPGTEIPLGGCAGTVAWLFAGRLTVFHAGDTSALLIGDAGITPLTSVHELENGAIYRYFGLGPFLQLEIQQENLSTYERLLLLTDGITKVFHPKEAARLISEHADPVRAGRDLANRAIFRGSTDDITVLLVDIDDFEGLE